MLKFALYFNMIFYGLVSIILCKFSFSKNNKVNWAIEAGVLLILALINVSLVEKCIEIGWNYLLIVVPIFAVTEVIFIITIVKNLLARKSKYESPTLPIAIAIIAVPVALFVITYSYELFRLNTCDYLLHFNYQNGIVISEDTYIAVTKHKPAKVTLENNLFNRKSTNAYRGIATNIHCNIYFNDKNEKDIRMYDDQSRKYEAVFDELGTAIYNENPNVEYIEIDYIPEENDAIVRIINTGDFIYHDNKRVAKLVSEGSLSEITVY